MMKFKNFVFSFDVHYSLFDILRFAFDLPMGRGPFLGSCVTVAYFPI